MVVRYCSSAPKEARATPRAIANWHVISLNDSQHTAAARTRPDGHWVRRRSKCSFTSEDKSKTFAAGKKQSINAPPWGGRLGHTVLVAFEDECQGKGLAFAFAVNLINKTTTTFNQSKTQSNNCSKDRSSRDIAHVTSVFHRYTRMGKNIEKHSKRTKGTKIIKKNHTPNAERHLYPFPVRLRKMVYFDSALLPPKKELSSKSTLSRTTFRERYVC